MLSLEAALERVLSGVSPLPSETVSLAAADRRWLVRDVASSIDLPAFDNSAMDGYAVLSAGLSAASPETPGRLRCLGEIPAGALAGRPIAAGECLRIFTGAPLPPGADAVVMQEDTQTAATEPDVVWITESVRPWENVRFRGEDVRAGSTLVQAGERLNFAKLGVLGAAGCREVEVGVRPKVGLLATGNELIEPGQPLAPGQIYESNRLMIQALASEAGCETRLYPIVRDSLAATRAALTEAFAACDVVITTGGVSVGTHDYVKEAFESLGSRLDLWKVAMRPGKPLAWGRLNQRHFFGLPGNPVSAAVTFLLLVRPALIRLQGGRNTALARAPGTLVQSIANPAGRRHFVRVLLSATGGVSPAGQQGSHVLSGLRQADGLLDVPADAAWAAGRPVEVLLFP